jgi:hypothetical protein
MRGAFLVAMLAATLCGGSCMAQTPLGLASGRRDALYAKAEDFDGWLGGDTPGRIPLKETGFSAGQHFQSASLKSIFADAPEKLPADDQYLDDSYDRAAAVMNSFITDADVSASPNGVSKLALNEPFPGSIPDPDIGPMPRTIAGPLAGRFPGLFPGSSDAATRKEYPNSIDERFHWRPAILEALFFTGLQHTFNLASEPGTRDTLNGHFLTHYLNSVSELRGWSDSDTFMAPYVGHSIEGSGFGFIERLNDPKYRGVQLGDGRDYWISLLRSMAFSAVWHTQWKIGPISEASIGNVMLHASPGFITLVDTPTLGTLTMLAEDAADKYLVMPFENKTTNRLMIVFVRSFLNPGRTTAYLMAFRCPWTRENRLGMSPADQELRRQLIHEYRTEGGEPPFMYVKPAPSGIEFVRKFPKEAPIELQAFPYVESFLHGGSCIGGGGNGAARLNPQWQIVAEISGCQVMHMPASNQSGDSLFYAVGPRWTPRADQKISPFAQVLLGGRKVTHETDNVALRKQLLKDWGDGSGVRGHYPTRFDWSVEHQKNGFSLAAGSGVDVVLTRAFAWRVVNVEYTHTWMGDVDMIKPQDGIRVTTGAVLRIGTW